MSRGIAGMNDLWQVLGVVVAVAAAACYLAMQWMPARWRRGVAGRLANGSRRLGLREAQAGRLAERLARKGGCSACDSCGGCGAAGAGAGPLAGRGPDAATGAGDEARGAAAAAGRPGPTVAPLIRHPRRG
jgi:hypothetical protein